MRHQRVLQGNNSARTGSDIQDAPNFVDSSKPEAAFSITQLARPKAHHERGAVGLGERFSFALERDDVGARRCDRLGWNDNWNRPGSDRRNLLIVGIK